MLESLKAWWKASKVEWQEKIEWSSFPQLLNSTIAVLVGSLLLAIVIGVVDLLFSTVLRAFYSLFY